MGSAKAPKAPDYSALAKQQAELDRQTSNQLTNANRVNQIDPYGQTSWSQSMDPVAQQQIEALTQQYNTARTTGKTFEEKALYDQIQGLMNSGNRWTQTTTLSPEQQALLNQQQGIQSQQNSRISDLLNTFKTPELKDANQNDIQNLLYGKLTQDYDKRFTQDEAAQRAQLANQGFQMGSEGYNNTLNDFNVNKNRAYGDAATQAALSSYDQMNKERSLNQSEYGQQMGYLTQLLGGPQGPTMPSYQPYAQATPYQSEDQLGAAQAGYQAKVGNANAQNAQKGQTMGTVGTVATAAAVVF